MDVVLEVYVQDCRIDHENEQERTRFISSRVGRVITWQVL